MKIKNIAIIAHVDHGKTTLVDCLLRQGGVFKTHELEKVEERVMDSDDIERERGITIFSKNASVRYKDYKINIVDTPGHADFGGEVQRIMKMVDSVLLLVDAFEGPMPQTKYVLKKALEQGHRPIVVVNKVDKPNARPEDVLYMVYDLFIELNANEYQLEFPVIYASGKTGFARKELTDENMDMQPLFETILEHVQDPDGDVTKPTQFLITNIAYDNYVGKLAVGRIHNGTLKRIKLDDIKEAKRTNKGTKIIRTIKTNKYNTIKALLVTNKDNISLIDEDIKTIKVSDIAIKDLDQAGTSFTKELKDMYKEEKEEIEVKEVDFEQLDLKLKNIDNMLKEI